MKQAIATSKRTHEILEKYQLHAQKRFGQNFLIDENVVKKIAEAACDKDCLVLEVGPGIGSLTEQLAKCAKEVVSYEIDKKLPMVLQQELADYHNITILNEDFLKVDLSNAFFANQEITFCSNLPYYITTPILFRLMESPLHLRRITVMMQKEVAQRLQAKPNDPEYGALSVIIAYRYEVKTVLQVKRHCFSPAPKVDSTVVSLMPIKERNFSFEKPFYSFVQQCFHQRRKTLFNNLKNLFEAERIISAFERCSLSLEVRAQELSLEDFITLFGVLYER